MVSEIKKVKNIFDYDLSKSSLIEASAGTGKTYSLTILYLRAILGIGVGKALNVEQILVITFTNAATAELRFRIGKAIVELLQALETGQISQDWQKDFTHYIEKKKIYAESKLRLKLAFDGLDDASIYTIDAWSNKILLKEGMFAGFDKQKQIESNIEKIKTQAYEDFWRIFMPQISAINAKAFFDNKIKKPDNLENILQTDLLEVQENQTEVEQELLHILNDADKAVEFNEEVENLMHNWLLNRIEYLKEKHKIYEFSILQTLLSKALQRGDYGKKLAKNLAEEYPLAFVDEFQDTNQAQFNIIDRIYLQADAQTPSPNSAKVLLIGDPKQSIYRFRGADLSVYLAARKKINNSWNLTTNYRSDKDLINAVNSFFDYFDNQYQGGKTGIFNFDINLEQKPDENKQFKEQDAKIVFTRANSSNKRAKMLIDGQEQSPIKAYTLDEMPTSKEKLRFEVAEQSATIISELINAKPILEFDEGSTRDLELKDICILVNNRFEAEPIKQALTKREIDAVQINREENLFEKFIFEDLLKILQAVQSCKPMHIRLALSSRLLGLQVQELNLLNLDAVHWRTYMEKFKNYRHIWQNQTLGEMLDKLVLDFNILGKLKANSEDREVIDFLQLCEVLQEKSMEYSNPEEVLEYLKNAGADAGEAQMQQRFLPDKPRVQIVTIHSSKGLEYNLVFIPFTITPIKRNSQDGERLAIEKLEEVRKFYVAMTRAKVGIYLGLNSLKKEEHFTDSVFGLWTNSAVENSFTKFLMDLRAVGDFINFVNTSILDANTIIEQPKVKQDIGQFNASYTAPNIEDWHMHSYSELKTFMQNLFDELSDSEIKNLDGKIEQRAEDATAQSEARSENLAQTPRRFFEFLPKGKDTGLMVHKILQDASTWQNAGKTGFAAFFATDETQKGEYYKGLFRKHPYDIGDEVSANLSKDLQEILTKDLGKYLGLEKELSLKDLNSKQAKAEMEFLFNIDNLQLNKLDEFLQKNYIAGAKRSSFTEDKVNGVMKGYIDLLFEYEGKYFVIDYKTNSMADASVQSMEAEILDYRYDLQALIYLQALHLFLRQNLKDYEPSKHLGGVGFWFLRHNSLYFTKYEEKFFKAFEQLF